MILNLFDEILFWEDIKPVADFYDEVKRKYFPPGVFFPTDEQAYRAAWEDFYKTEIPTKEDFLRRCDIYVKKGGPVWIFGRSQSCDELSEVKFKKAILYSKTEHGKEIAESKKSMFEHRAPEFWSIYSENAVWKDDASILELTVGGGCGTTCVMSRMGPENVYCGIDIDFVCAKNADALARHFGINGLGLAASLWDIPFKDDTFDTVCSNQGLEELREIPTVMREAARVLKKHGKMVLHVRLLERTQSPRYFKRFGIDDRAEQIKLLRDLRLFESPEQVIELAAESGLRLEHRTDDVVWGSILVFEK